MVIHLAGPPSVAASFTAPGEFLRAHVLGTATVVELCRRSGSRAWCTSPRRRSTAGPPGTRSTRRRRSRPVALRGGQGRRRGRHRRGGPGRGPRCRRAAPVLGVRPGARRDGVLGLILAGARGPRIRLRKLDGIRDHCYVDDLAAAVWRAATSELTGIHTYNVATGPTPGRRAGPSRARRLGTESLPGGPSVAVARPPQRRRSALGGRHRRADRRRHPRPVTSLAGAPPPRWPTA